jgi:hypothetical protein
MEEITWMLELYYFDYVFQWFLSVATHYTVAIKMDSAYCHINPVSSFFILPPKPHILKLLSSCFRFSIFQTQVTKYSYIFNASDLDSNIIHFGDPKYKLYSNLFPLCCSLVHIIYTLNTSIKRVHVFSFPQHLMSWSIFRGLWTMFVLVPWRFCSLLLIYSLSFHYYFLVKPANTEYKVAN